MLQGQNISALVYFLTHYFTISTNASDVPMLGREYRLHETAERTHALLEELRMLQAAGDWKAVQHYVHTYSSRLMSRAQVQQLVDTLIHALADGDPSQSLSS